MGFKKMPEAELKIMKVIWNNESSVSSKKMTSNSSENVLAIQNSNLPKK